jgi:hypothetical protein
MFCLTTLTLYDRGNATVSCDNTDLFFNHPTTNPSQDLSLLTHLTPKDIAHLQTVGKDAQEARKEFILRDDQNAVWTHLKSLKAGRLDFVLDNGEYATTIGRIVVL